MQEYNNTPYQRVIYLITAANKGSISEAEAAELTAWLNFSENNRILYGELTRADKKKEALELMGSFDTPGALNLVKQKISVVKSRRRHRLMMLTAAACVLIITGLALLRTGLLEQKPVQELSMLPEGNKAVLITADGEVISLDSDKSNADRIEHGKVKVDADAGLISYLMDKGTFPAPSALRYNTIKTPKGGQYEVLLSDGTKVYLNAESILTYPVQFGATERRVKLSGEGYFEVNKDKTRPFFVESGVQEVKVLGTHFNIQAYPGDAVMTTGLLEGSVQLNGGKQPGKVLVPGEVAKYNPGANLLEVEKVRTSEIALWRSGYFQFTEEPIEEVMKKVSRWYNVEVHFEGNRSKDLFSGTITHYQKLQDVLTTLELTGKVKFKYNGKEVIVDKK